MANLKEIRKRIVSVKNTQQITRAMRMVAAAKLRRAQESLMQGRPYALNLLSTIRRLSSTASFDSTTHPLMRKPTHSRTLLLVVTSDRGLCGAFNSNIIRKAERFIEENENVLDSIDMAFIGRKGYDYFRRRTDNIAHYFRDIYDGLSSEKIRDNVAPALIKEFVDEKYDRVFLLYNEFKSVIAQNVVVESVLPIAKDELNRLSEEGMLSDHAMDDEDLSEYIYEPDPNQLLEYLLPLYISTQIFHACEESFAAEMGARMSAMESATNNASDLIASLTLAFNRARQAAITTEIIEIVSGAEAL